MALWMMPCESIGVVDYHICNIPRRLHEMTAVYLAISRMSRMCSVEKQLKL
jgi:hypothetical protein